MDMTPDSPGLRQPWKTFRTQVEFAVLKLPATLLLILCGFLLDLLVELPIILLLTYDRLVRRRPAPERSASRPIAIETPDQ